MVSSRRHQDRHELSSLSLSKLQHRISLDLHVLCCAGRFIRLFSPRHLPRHLSASVKTFLLQNSVRWSLFPQIKIDCSMVSVGSFWAGAASAFHGCFSLVSPPIMISSCASQTKTAFSQRSSIEVQLHRFIGGWTVPLLKHVALGSANVQEIITVAALL